MTSVTPPPVMRSPGVLSMRRSRLIQRGIAATFYTIGILICMAAISHAAYGFFTEAPYFKLRDIQIRGVSSPVQDELSELVDSIVGPNRNLLSLDEDILSAQIVRHPRVRDLSLQTTLDGILTITAMERKPLAILDSREQFYLIDEDAHVLEQVEPTDILEYEIPFISGVAQEEVQVGEKIHNPSMPKVLSLLQVVKDRNRDFYQNISEVEIGFDTASHLENITVHMLDGMDVRFGDRDPVSCMPAYEVVVEQIKEQDLDLYKDILYIDLRFEGLGVWIDRYRSLLVDAQLQAEMEAELQASAESNASKSSSNKRESPREGTVSGSTQRSRPGTTGRTRPSSAYDMLNAR